MKKDVAMTLQKISSIGYKEVEFAGYFGQTPKQIKNYLTDFGLTSPSTHIEIQLIRDYGDQVIESAKAIGHQYMLWLG